MLSSLRIVVSLPLDTLWDAHGKLEAKRQNWLSKTALQEMLGMHPVIFLVADVGKPLRRMRLDQCYDFWKSEVKNHMVENPEEAFSLESFPAGYAYVASAWLGSAEGPIVLLEKHH